MKVPYKTEVFSNHHPLFPVVLALIFQKYLVQSLTAGGVKG